MRTLTDKKLVAGYCAVLAALVAGALSLLWAGALYWVDGAASRALGTHARAVAVSVQATVEDALVLGVPLAKLRGVDAYFARLLEENGDIRFIALVDPNGRPLFTKGEAPEDLPAEDTWHGTQSVDIHSGEAAVGTVVVGAKPLGLAAELGAFGGAAGAALAGGLVLAVLVGRMLPTRVCFAPLGRVLAQMESGVRGQFDGIDRRQRRDEIGLYVRALALSARLLRERAQQLREFAEEVQTVVADPRLAERVETVRLAAAETLGETLFQTPSGPEYDERNEAVTQPRGISLRLRVTMIVFAAVVLVSLGLAFTASYRETLSAEANGAETVAMVENNWRKLTERTVTGLADSAAQLAADPRISQTVAARDTAALITALQAARDRITDLRPDIDIDVAALDGGLLYGGSGMDGTSLFGDFAITTMERTGEPIRGLALTPGREVLEVFARPISQDGRVVGTLTLTREVAPLLRELSGIIGAESFLIDLDGKLIHGSAPQLWQKIGGAVVLGQRGLHPLQAGGAEYATLALGLPTLNSGRLGYLVSVRDVTEQQARSHRLKLAFYGVTALLIALAALMVYTYLCVTFAPLDAAIAALHTLSRGETSVMLELPSSDDEVGRLAGAVRVFRDRTRALGRVSEERARRRRRQERLIRRQMLTLAETLQDGAREAVLKDLDNIERAASSQSSGAEVAAELDALVIAFQTMSGRVREQHRELDMLVAELREALKAKTAFIALQQELEIARELQLSILPRVATDHLEYEAHALMTPAKEVGGDFYDFFELSPRRVGMVVADVSGKGVPAALFMAVSRTLLKATAQFRVSPRECLEKLNGLLVEGNEKQLFVTVFYGILDLDTGALTYANGGHNHPMLITREGDVVELEGTEGIALAIEPDLEYHERTIVMRPGDTIVLYTDGVTEAKNPCQTEFGEQRLTAILRQSAGMSAHQITDRVLDAVHSFTNEGPQTDDITCFAFHYKGVAAQVDTRVFMLRNDLNELPGLRTDIERFLETFALPREIAFNICLSLDEIFTNIVSYGYEDPAEHQIEVVLRHDGEAVTATIVDDGKEYDPLAEAPEPDLDADLDARAVGGLGIFLVRTFMDDIRYSRDGERNRLVIVKRVCPEENADPLLQA